MKKEYMLQRIEKFCKKSDLQFSYDGDIIVINLSHSNMLCGEMVTCGSLTKVYHELFG